MDMYTRKDGTTKTPVKRTDLVEAHWTPSEIERDWDIVKPQWSGDGLPPVGTLCEFTHDGSGVMGRWIKCEVLAFGGKGKFGETVAIRTDDSLFEDAGGLSVQHALHEISWRPTRTAEQIAAEEREQWIQSFCNEVDVPHAIGARTFDKGYPKQADQ